MTYVWTAYACARVSVSWSQDIATSHGRIVHVIAHGVFATSTDAVRAYYGHRIAGGVIVEPLEVGDQHECHAK